MVMLTYIARTGRETPLSGESECADAIRAGDLHRESLVMDGRTGRWMRAAEHGQVAALLDRVPVGSGVGRPAAAVLKVLTVTAWLAAIVAPPVSAWAIGADPIRILQRSLVYTVVLAAVGAAVGIYVKSSRGRWSLALVVAILALAAGLGALAMSTGTRVAELSPAVTTFFAPRAKWPSCGGAVSRYYVRLHAARSRAA